LSPSRPDRGEARNETSLVVAVTSPHAGQIESDDGLFRAADRFHISTNPSRVARAAAERARLRLNSVPEQRLAVQEQAWRKRTFKSLRQLMAEAPYVLLALKPLGDRPAAGLPVAACPGRSVRPNRLRRGEPGPDPRRRAERPARPAGGRRR
jgi:hypothetical protein